MFRIVSIVLLLSVTPSFAVDANHFVGPPEENRVTRLPLPADAQAIALEDLKRLNIVDRLYTRYIWIREPNAMTIKNQSFAVNTISCATLRHKPPVLGNGMLLRINFKLYTENDEELKRWIETWEELAFDPSFSLLITKDILDNLRKSQIEVLKVLKRKGSVSGSPATSKTVLIEVPDWDDSRNWEETPSEPYVQNGRTLNTVLTKKKNPPIKKKVESTVSQEKRGIEVEGVFIEIPLAEVKVENTDVVRLDAEHLNPQVSRDLQVLTQSLAPVVESNYFLFRALSTIQSALALADQNKAAKEKNSQVYKIIYGGLYYEFAGILTAAQAKAKNPNTTDLDILFFQLGIADADKSDNAEKLFARIRSDQRVGISASEVAGKKPRQVEILRSPLGPLNFESWVSITHDIEDEHIDINSSAIKNLAKFQDDAREVIWMRRNGLHGFALYNGQGVLQREVPFNVANDSTIPKPYTQRLQAAIGCIRCHASESGWRSAPNDVSQFIKHRKADVFGDLTNGNDLIDDTNKRLAGLYQGEFDDIFRKARNDYARVILDTCGPTVGQDDPTQTKIARIVGDSVGAQYNAYAFETVDPHKALLELGWKVPRSKAKDYINLLLPPLRGYHPVAVLAPFQPEDSTIALLRDGKHVNRFAWNLVYTQALIRSQQALATLPNFGKESK